MSSRKAETPVVHNPDTNIPCTLEAMVKSKGQFAVKFFPQGSNVHAWLAPPKAAQEIASKTAI